MKTFNDSENSVTLCDSALLLMFPSPFKSCLADERRMVRKITAFFFPCRNRMFKVDLRAADEPGGTHGQRAFPLRRAASGRNTSSGGKGFE